MINKGFDYEDKIIKILQQKKIIDESIKSPKGSDAVDVPILYKNNKVNLELKNNNKGADYGQKELLWNKENSWHWSLGKKKIKDSVVKQYEEMQIIDRYIDKDFIPRKYSKILLKEQKISSIYEEVTKEDYLYDKKRMEKPNIIIPLETLFKYYENKNIFYIQIEDSGFYHLSKDVFSLGTSQFNGSIALRLRAKYRKSSEMIDKEPWHYGFLAKIQLKVKPSPSSFDIEEKEGKEFPFKD
ncbi:MAG: hypothetical protein P8M06_05350 [Pelagibacterales bacterium]|nr:hypothetical protein [Pelagibacterales bacterium]